MRSTVTRAGATAVAALALSVAGSPAAFGATATGPSSSASPYVLPSQPDVTTKSILTVGDEVPKAGGGTYRMVGIPDGLGAFINDASTFTLLSNHELGSSAGIARDHGAAGAFVSRWSIQSDSLKVDEGGDLIQQIATWNTATASYNPAAKGVALNRLCSATLAPITAFFNPLTLKGYAGRLFMDGEEGGTDRAFAHQMDGTSWELPALGKMAYENVSAHPFTGDATIVAETDDSTPGQVYVYKGAKSRTGSSVDKAGLTNGTLYGIKVDGVTDESRDTGIPSGTRFAGASLGDVRSKSAADLESASNAAGITRFLRPEDNAWDPTNPNVLYFVTTDRFNTATSPGRSRLWRLTFDDVTKPELGGTIEMLLDGTEGQQMLDNITVNLRGQVLLQEDPGNQDYVAKVWLYSPKADKLTEIAHFDPDRFAPGAPSLLTVDEESSGIIDATTVLGPGWYLLDVQAHYPIPGELVEGGQYLALQVPLFAYPS